MMFVNDERTLHVVSGRSGRYDQWGEIGGWSAALMLGATLAYQGFLIGGPVGGDIGGFIGSSLGYFLGSNANKLWNDFKNWVK